MTQLPVAVPRGALRALVVALVASMLAVAFLVGRESGRSQQPVPAPGATVTAANAPSLTATATLPSSDTSASTLPAIEVPPATSPVAAAVGPSPPSVSPGSAPRDTLHGEVANYFREVEAIQSQARSAGDPEALARTLLEQGAKGDVSGLAALAAANQKVRDGLRAVAVPEPCREHHRQTLALIEESVAMLERVRSQLGGDDESSLAALPAEGRALEQQAKDVDALAAAIKRRFGL